MIFTQMVKRYFDKLQKTKIMLLIGIMNLLWILFIKGANGGNIVLSSDR